jgi:predicted RNA-binding protein YlqC (UPF0109 family)
VIEHPLYQPLFRRYAEGTIYKPSLMSVNEAHLSGRNVTLFVRVHNDDIGLLCGTGAKNIKALQSIFREAGRVNGHNVRIAVDRLDCDMSKPQPKFQPRPQWIEGWDKSPEAIGILKDTVKLMGYKAAEIKAHEHHDTTYLTMKTDAPAELFEAMATAIHTWGRSMGRHIFLIKPENLKTA